ncbi:MAG: IPT/TIG domain-containing protein [Candidatus Methanoperedens sp.]|nr:IPT/TIG domain-containing protein [Candidatus Methanoperedens sp.]
MSGPIGSQTLTISRNCHDCHDGTAWTVDPFINLSVIRGAPGRPHHNTTKNSASNLAVPAAYLAADRQCKTCHGDSILDNYDDGHYVPSYNASMVSPVADFKINATIGGGREWGGCAACHDANSTAVPYINSNYENHHYVRFWIGYQCNNCHVSSGLRAEPVPDYNPEPSANFLRVWFINTTPYNSYVTMFGWDTSIRHIEFRNNTILTGNNDPVNGTGCEKCHSVQDLHNIQYDAANTIANKIPGYGHIGNNSDCNGCHQGWAGAVDNPFPGPKSIQLDSVSPGALAAGVAVDVTLTGSNFVEDPYTTTVLVDGVPATQKSLTDTQIVVTVNLAVGAHSIQVEKGGVTSKLATLTAAAPGTITSAKLTSGVLTIDGVGLGANQQMVAITKADGRIVPSDSITSSTDTQIVAVSSQAAVGDTVTVITPTGSATAAIEAGATPTPTPTPTPATSLTVTSPNGGENWKRGTTYTITWTKVGNTGANVKIELLKGTSATTIAKSVSNIGTYSWKISSGQSLATNYKIRITSTSNPGYTDTSDSNFQISK